MTNGKLQVLLIILIGVLTGCGGALKIVTGIPTTPSPSMVSENPTKEMDDQFRLNEPRYSVSLPQNKMLHKSLYLKEKKRLYLWVYENNAYELIAIDLGNSKALWTCKLPKKTTVYEMGTTESEDIYLDLNYSGRALIFLDPDQGIEKWRHGKNAKEGETGYCKYFNRKFNFLVNTDAIIVQDPNTYQTLNTIERFKMDCNRPSQGHTRFYNIHVYEIDNRFIIIDNGLHAISGESGQTLWSSKFPTIATRYHTGKNVALAVLGAFAGVYGGGRGPDYYFPSALIIQGEDAYFVSALSNLYRINSSTGHIEWAYDLGIGSANSMAKSENRIYLASCGEYESGILSFEQENGTQSSSFQTPFTPSIEAEVLSPEKLETLTENEMWERNLACYDAVIGKTGIVPDDKLVYYPVVYTRDEIVVLSNRVISVFDKLDGHTIRSLQNPGYGCNRFERILPFGEGQIMALSKNEIVVINIQDFSLAWKFNADWAIDDINKFNINSISTDHLYVRTFIDNKIKGCILKKETGEIVSRFEADQSLRGEDYLALSIDNGIYIYQ